MANLTDLKVNWKEQKCNLQRRFALLSENGLMFDEGKNKEMIGKLEAKFGKTKEQIKAIISAL